MNTQNHVSFTPVQIHADHAVEKRLVSAGINRPGEGT